MSAAGGAGDVDADTDDEPTGLGEDMFPTDEPQAGSTIAITTATQTALLIAVRL